MRIISCPQGSEAWFAARRGLPTASRFDKIITPVKAAPSSAQDGLIDELIAEALIPVEADRPKYVSSDMEFGMKLEAEARCAYELGFTQHKLTEVGFVLATCGMFGGSPDALVGEEGGAEIKCPAGTTHIGYVRAGVLPSEYKCQVHGYMVVTGRPWWDFFSYHRGLRPFHLRVEADDFTLKLGAELFRFCTRLNEARAKFDLKPLGLPSP